MRTTIELDPDTAAALRQIRQESGLGVSEGVNELIRRGLTSRPAPAPFVPTVRDLGLTVDVSTVAEALETLEGVDHR